MVGGVGVRREHQARGAGSPFHATSPDPALGKVGFAALDGGASPFPQNQGPSGSGAEWCVDTWTLGPVALSVLCISRAAKPPFVQSLRRKDAWRSPGLPADAPACPSELGLLCGGRWHGAGGGAGGQTAAWTLSPLLAVVAGWQCSGSPWLLPGPRGLRPALHQVPPAHGRPFPSPLATKAVSILLGCPQTPGTAGQAPAGSPTPSESPQSVWDHRVVSTIGWGPWKGRGTRPVDGDYVILCFKARPEGRTPAGARKTFCCGYVFTFKATFLKVQPEWPRSPPPAPVGSRTLCSGSSLALHVRICLSIQKMFPRGPVVRLRARQG